jgi:hypothetical protein
MLFFSLYSSKLSLSSSLERYSASGMMTVTVFAASSALTCTFVKSMPALIVPE